MKKLIGSLFLASAFLSGTHVEAAPLATTLTYQGGLANAGSAVSGSYDLKFTLYDAVAEGDPVTEPLTNSGVAVVNGLFTTTLDFGNALTNGYDRWLDIQVRPAGGGTFTVLSPRQALSAAPYAQYAPSAGSAAMASAVVQGGVTAGMIADRAVSNAKIGYGAVTQTNIDDGGEAAYSELLAPMTPLATGPAPSFPSLSLFPSSASPSLTLRLDGTAVGTVTAFTATEALSEPYEYVVEVSLPHPELQPAEQAGRRAQVIFARSGRSTSFAGVVSACSLSSADGRRALYVFRIQSPLSYLAFSSDYRVNQNISLPSLAARVYQDRTGLSPVLSLTGSHPNMDSATQYGESDLNFFSRILARDGVFYFFDPGSSVPALILGDSATAFINASTGLRYLGDAASGAPSGEELIRTLRKGLRQAALKTTLNSYSLENPKLNLVAAAENPGGGQGDDYELELYRSGADGQRLALIRQQAIEARRSTLTGTSTAPDLRPGFKFTIEDATDAGLGGSYVVTRVRHGAFRRMTNGVASFLYGNEFEVLPLTTPFRAPPAAHPAAAACTGVVTGPAGQEIYTDMYGRVKVRFHWDRYGAADETSSAWVRVASPMSGQGWGMYSVPRVGQEVMVSFINGDPDNPVITGSLYNGDNMVPYALPTAKTRSGIRTQSSPGGGGYNEIRFEDKKGSEELFIKAQKDLNINVGDHVVMAAGSDMSLSSGNNLLVTAGNLLTISSANGVSINGGSDPSKALTVGGAVTATSFSGSGAGLTAVNGDTLDSQHGAFYQNAGNLNAGTLADARLSGNVAMLNAPQTFTAAKTFDGQVNLRNWVQVFDSVYMNDADIHFRNDPWHGVGWFGDTKLFAGVNVNGPVLYGNGGGGLGSISGVTNLALNWNEQGQIGIGTTPTAHLLHLNSAANVNTMRLTGPGSWGSGAKINFGDADIVYVQEVLDDILRIQANRTGVGRTPTTNMFEVEGNASKSSAGQWLANSDARIKTGVATITNALGVMEKLRLVSFRYDDNYRSAHPSLGEHLYFNVIAQEFEKVFPDYVRGSGERLSDGSEILQVDPWPITIYSAAAVQELNEKVQAQEMEIQSLRRENAAMLERIEAIERAMR